MPEDYNDAGFDNFMRRDGVDLSSQIDLTTVNQEIAESSITIEKLDSDTIIQLRNVDEEFVSGEIIDVRDTVGFVGEITETTTDIVCAQATFADEANPTINQDGAGDIAFLDTTEKQGFMSFTNAPAIPSGTGISVLTVEIKLTGRQFSGNTNQELKLKDLAATFNEPTMTWNTGKPAFNNEITSLPYVLGAFDTDFFIVTQAEYNNVRDNGIGGSYDADNGATTNIGDEDDGTPPILDVRFKYKIEDGKIYQINASNGAGGAQDYTDSFAGIALTDASDGTKIKIRSRGIVKGFSGLTARSTYFLADTDGNIQDSAGTNSKVIGRASSTTDLEVNYDVAN